MSSFSDYFKRRIPGEGGSGTVFWYVLPMAKRLWATQFSIGWGYKSTWQYLRLKDASETQSSCMLAAWGD